MRLAIDVSHWEDAAYDYQVLKRRGIEMVCAKATQGDYYKDDKYAYHTGEGKKAGMLTGAYHFFDPAIAPVRQIDTFLQYTSTFTDVDFYCLDVEREWVSRLVKTAKNKTGTWQQERVSGYSLDKAIFEAYRELKSKGKKPVVIYTRKNWILEYCPLMLKWVKNEPLWLAAYPDDHDRSKMTTEQDADYLNEINKLSLTWLDIGEFTNVILWQFSQYYKCPGMGNITDLNMILDDEKYAEWIPAQTTPNTTNLEVGSEPAIDRLPSFLSKLRELIDQWV